MNARPWMTGPSHLATSRSDAIAPRDLEAWMLAQDPARLRISADEIVKVAGFLSLGIADLHTQGVRDRGPGGKGQP
jgi:hypothetical protein